MIPRRQFNSEAELLAAAWADAIDQFNQMRRETAGTASTGRVPELPVPEEYRNCQCAVDDAEDCARVRHPEWPEAVMGPARCLCECHREED